MNAETLEQWVAQYEANKTLPSKKIPCSTDGCETETVCFGTNLTSRVEKAGGIRAFLTNFKCRACRKSEKQANNQNILSASRKQRFKAATASVETTEVSTEDLMTVFAEV